MTHLDVFDLILLFGLILIVIAALSFGVRFTVGIVGYLVGRLRR